MSLLPSGTYTIEYAAPPTDVVVMTEPALVLDLEVSAADNGKTDDFSLLMCGSVNIQAKLRLWNDPNPIDQALLPAGTTYSTRLEQNGMTVAEDNTSLMRLENVDIRGNNSEVKAEVLLPGIGRVYARQSIKLPSINLSADKTLVTTSLREFCAGMDGFTLKLESDQEIGQALAADANLLLDTELPLKCRKNADNTYTIYCEEQSLAPLARYGDYTVKISADSSVNIEPLTLTWHVVEPKFEITGGLGGLDSLSRLDMWKQQESALALATMTDTSSLVPDEQIYASFQLNLMVKFEQGTAGGLWRLATVLYRHRKRSVSRSSTPAGGRHAVGHALRGGCQSDQSGDVVLAEQLEGHHWRGRDHL